MTLLSLSTLGTGFGYDDGDSTEVSVDLKSVLTEVRGMRFSVINGGTATQALTLTGINASYDTLRSILILNDVNSGATFAMAEADVSLASISANNTIKIGATTTNKKLLIIWFDRSYGS